VCLHDEHVHESCFTMVKVSSEGDVADLAGKVHQIGHKFATEENGRQVGLFDCELLLYDGSDNGL